MWGEYNPSWALGGLIRGCPGRGVVKLSQASPLPVGPLPQINMGMGYCDLCTRTHEAPGSGHGRRLAPEELPTEDPGAASLERKGLCGALGVLPYPDPRCVHALLGAQEGSSYRAGWRGEH